MQVLEDFVPDVRFVVRDYGVLVVKSDRVPSGAVPVHDFWKAAKAEEDALNDFLKGVADQPESSSVDLGSMASIPVLDVEGQSSGMGAASSGPKSVKKKTKTTKTPYTSTRMMTKRPAAARSFPTRTVGRWVPITLDSSV